MKEDTASSGRFNDSDYDDNTFYFFDYYFEFGAFDVPGFGGDEPQGHGTHVAGTAAGATLTTPASTASCSETEQLSCLGACLNTTRIKTLTENYFVDWDTWCEQFACDGSGDECCLGKDVGMTLAENGGIARGAKLSIFDASDDGYSMFTEDAGNGMWESSEETGSKVHTNSWGSFSTCYGTAESIMYDAYIHEVSCPLQLPVGVESTPALFFCCMSQLSTSRAMTPPRIQDVWRTPRIL